MKNALAALLLATLLLTAAAAPPADTHFAYEPKASLDIVTSGVETRGDVVIQDLSYASPKGGRVPAYLVVPAGKGPFGAVVWGREGSNGFSLRRRWSRDRNDDVSVRTARPAPAGITDDRN